MTFRQRILGFYYRKIHWRLSRLPIQLRRAWRNYSFRRWIASQHWLWVLLMGFATAYFIWWVKGKPDLEGVKSIINEAANSENPPWTLFLALLSAPVAYVLWFFRHQNSLLQIENNRKDINLKDFQKLSEWASGLHLPEDKVTSTEKNIDKLIKKGGDTESPRKFSVFRNKAKILTGKSTDSESCKELTEAIETYSPTKGVLSGHPTRHDGAASLQIAAIYQLEAFLRGDYGKFFRRPAFQLLKSLWLSLMQPHVDAWKKVEQELQKVLENPADKEKWDAWRKDSLDEWKKKLWETIGSPLGIALTTVLAVEAGKNFREHAEDLPNGCFAGLNHQLPSLKSLELDELKLVGINLQGAFLWNANLQGAYLNYANLQGAFLWMAKLQGADLSEANLQGASLSEANLQGAYLREANLQGAFLWMANLQGADLSEANLQGASLWNANLQGASLWNANLQGASLSEANLQGASLWNANLQGASLSEANLQGAYLRKANLQGAYLRKAKLQGAILRNIQIDDKTEFHAATADDKTVIEVNEWKVEGFVRDEAKSKDLRDQLIAKGLKFVDSKE